MKDRLGGLAVLQLQLRQPRIAAQQRHQGRHGGLLTADGAVDTLLSQQHRAAQINGLTQGQQPPPPQGQLSQRERHEAIETDDPHPLLSPGRP